jgi:hypothetical protein
MVAYDLVCKKNHRFEGWFPSFEGFKEQAEKRLISCPTCGSTNVERVAHACAVVSSRGEKEERKEAARKKKSPEVALTPEQAKELLIRLNHYVRENFEDVGSRFAEEARAIFYGRSEKKAIHGTSTSKERKELDEEGVPYVTLPKPELDS